MKNKVTVSRVPTERRKSISLLRNFSCFKNWRKTIFYLMFFAAFGLLSGCTAQSMLSYRISSEWAIEKFELREVSGGVTTVENAGTIIFDNNGHGTQSLITTLSHTGESSDSEFKWENTVHTVSINVEKAEAPKVWIVVKSQRTRQEWYSTDSKGNVQVMHLKKK